MGRNKISRESRAAKFACKSRPRKRKQYFNPKTAEQDDSGVSASAKKLKFQKEYYVPNDNSVQTNMAEIFSGKVFLLVTGASRGIGKTVAEKFASLLKGQSHVLLLARNANNLKKTADDLPKNLVTSYESVDFSHASTDQLREIVLKGLKGEQVEKFDQAIIVHSAAMANMSQLTNTMTDFDEWRKCFHLNTFSPAVINGVFMSIFGNKNIKKYVINISSYLGQNPEAYVGSYCTATAAKNMFFRVFAQENPDVSVINYLPGIVETDMFYDALNESKNEELKSKLKDLKENKKLVTPDQTITYLIELLRSQKYISGHYVDFNDHRGNENSVKLYPTVRNASKL